MKTRYGFTLVELMIVVSIIVVIVGLAVPNLLRSRISANEASAVKSTRLISTSETGFQTAGFVDNDGDGCGDYGTLLQLGNPDGAGATPPFIDNVLASGRKAGYRFTVTVTLGAAGVRPSYTCVTIPSDPGRTGQRQYFVDESGVIRSTSDGTPPGPNTPAL